jgi:hypothetical protein
MANRDGPDWGFGFLAFAILIAGLIMLMMGWRL